LAEGAWAETDSRKQVVSRMTGRVNRKIVFEIHLGLLIASAPFSRFELAMGINLKPG
jgi:hypothetical protein